MRPKLALCGLVLFLATSTEILAGRPFSTEDGGVAGIHGGSLPDVLMKRHDTPIVSAERTISMISPAVRALFSRSRT